MAEAAGWMGVAQGGCWSHSTRMSVQQWAGDIREELPESSFEENKSSKKMGRTSGHSAKENMEGRCDGSRAMLQKRKIWREQSLKRWMDSEDQRSEAKVELGDVQLLH